MRLVLYARASSDPNAIERSVTSQLDEGRALAAREGHDIVAEFVDNDRSASKYASGDRPQYRRLVEFLKADGADILATWEASRAQRDLDAYVKLRKVCQDSNTLWAYSGRVYDLSRTDDAFTTGLDALLAERESGVMHDRLMRGIRQSAALGRPHGRLTYGYERQYDPATAQLVAQTIQLEQAEVIREAARRVLAGETPYAVAQDFNDRGIPTPRPTRPLRDEHGDKVTDDQGNVVRVANGAKWDLTQVKRLCVNPAYIGKRVHQGEIVGDAIWPAILDEATFYALKSKLSDPSRRSQRDSAVKHLLSGIATCGPCGGRIRVQKNRGFYAYLCVQGFCVSRKEVWVDDLVDRVMIARLSMPDVAELAEGVDVEADVARGEAAELRSRLEGFVDAAAAGELTPKALARIEARLLPQIASAEARSRAGVSPVVASLAGPDIGGRWYGLPLTVRREAVQALYTVRILPTGTGRRSFDPSSVELEPRV